MSIVYIVTVLYALVHIGATATLHLCFEDVETETIDPEYFDPEYTARFATDDNTLGTNWTIIKQFPPETTGSIEIFGYSMGQYTTPTAQKLVWPFCEMVRDLMTKEYFTALGISYDACPPEPGTYFQESYDPSMESMPNNIPDNKYLVIFQIAVGEKFLFQDKVYVDTKTF